MVLGVSLLFLLAIPAVCTTLRSRQTRPEHAGALWGVIGSEELEVANHLVIGDIVGDQGNLIMQRTGRDPGVRGLDGTPLPAGFPGDLRPFGARFPACGKHDILGEMLVVGQFQFVDY